MKIRSVHAREILDSRGNPTLEAEVLLDTGTMARAMVPSGASTGAHEAHELRDNDPDRYNGKGVLKAVENVNGKIARAVAGFDVADQERLDETLIALDGTPNKERLGANAILAVSLGAAHAAAQEKDVPLFEHVQSLSNAPRAPMLPLPQCNVLNGGAHTDWETTNIQEFMVAPVGAVTFADAVRMLAETFHALKKVLQSVGYATSVGDEGGFAPKVGSDKEAFELVACAIEEAGYALGSDFVFTPDVASSEFYENGSYTLPLADTTLTSEQMIGWYKELAKKYPVASIEDGLAEDDWDGWVKLTATLGDSVQLVGDDLLVTNTAFLERAIREKAANAILIKVNQIGTLTETIRAVDMAHNAGLRAVISHRSGETEDTTIAHLAVGLGTGQIKTGSMSRTDRLAKYNELLRIEERLGARAAFAGNVFKE